MERLSQVNYKRIYFDILTKKFPGEVEKFRDFFKKEELSGLDIIELNDRIFGKGDEETKKFNQKHRSYSRKTILKILDNQKKHRLSNSEVAKEYNLSRNTLAKWKRIFK